MRTENNLIIVLVRMFFGLFMFLLVSCNHGGKNDSSYTELEDAKYDEILEVHDSAMYKLDELMALKISLQDELDRMEKGVIEVHEERKKAIMEIIKELEMADDGMMDWMRKHGRMPADTLSHEVIGNLLMESFSKAVKMNANIDSAIKHAQQLQK